MSAENSRFLPNSFSKKETRRVFLGRGVKIAEGAGSILLLAKIFGFPAANPEYPNPERIDLLTFERLQQYEGFQTIAHNGAGPHYKAYAKTGCNFMEADVYKYHGEIYVGHEEYFGNIGVDQSQGSITFSGPSRKLSSVIRRMKRDGYRPFIDFKDTDSPKQALGILKEQKMLADAVFSGEAWAALETVKEEQGGDTSNLYYTMQNESSIKTFFNPDGFPDGPFGVSMDEGIASEENIGRFKDAGATVFVYPIKTARQALRVLANGADGLITNNLTLLSFQATAV